MDRTVRVGPALAVGRMVIPSDLVERGKKGKALTLLHAWKDQLWEMGGGEKPPRPQLLQGNLNKEDDTDRERTGGRNETDAKPQSKIFENEGSLRGLSQEGMCPWGVHDNSLKIVRGLRCFAGCPSRIDLCCTVESAASVLLNSSAGFLREIYFAIPFLSTHESREYPGGYRALRIWVLGHISQGLRWRRADKNQ